MASFLDIKVVPSSGRNGWVLDDSGGVKCYLKSPAEKGKANKELIALLSRLLGIPQYAIVVQQGLTTPKKRVKVGMAITQEEFIQKLGL